jgi:outer membrane lipoprotein-sorting protein
MRIYFKGHLKFFLLLFSSFFFISGAPNSKHDLSPYEIVKGMFVKTDAISTMTYTMKKQERFHGKLLMQQTAVKLNRNPLKVFLRQEFPKAGLEVLYVQGFNNNNALVNTNGFPWVNLSLDPMGSTMRENQHHTLFDSGYSHLVSILEHLADKYNKDIENMIINNGTVNWNGHTCWFITFSNPNFKYEPYTVKAGETILTIAAKSKLSEYMILELNKNISNYTDVSAGQIITVPSDYSPKLEIYIDKQQMIPYLIKVYDDKGLYEQYEYYNVVINPTFKSNEFDKDFPEYKF